ncbi:hypothetical protein H5410_014770 [Solanum commersonii]|uniref:Uncharacterized protein n=1 Tax=Solanum commersonii TaxID=4109 RepID=A0A9J5ZSD8_SOLCO|nr:hypothetical protein H5410_014770 [Solanum commersonii]
MDKELQQIKSQQHDNKYAELSPSEDLQIPELESDDGKHRKTQTNNLLHAATAIGSTSATKEDKTADMEEIQQWILSLLKPEQKPTTRAIRQNFISPEIMANYCRTIGHKYSDHQCSKSYGEDNVIPAVKLE